MRQANGESNNRSTGLFFALLLSLPVLTVFQHVAIKFFTKDEPYPALLLPGFGSRGTNDSTMDVTLFKLAIGHLDGDSTELLQSEVLSGIPTSYHDVVMTQLVPMNGDVAKLSPDAGVWLVELAKERVEPSQIRNIKLQWWRIKFEGTSEIADEAKLLSEVVLRPA